MLLLARGQTFGRQKEARPTERWVELIGGHYHRQLFAVLGPPGREMFWLAGRVHRHRGEPSRALGPRGAKRDTGLSTQDVGTLVPAFACASWHFSFSICRMGRSH